MMMMNETPRHTTNRTRPDCVPYGKKPGHVSSEEESLRRVRAALIRWGMAPKRMDLIGRELDELDRELEDILSPAGGALLEGGTGSGHGDATLYRVLRREQFTERCRANIAQLEEDLAREHSFCFTVDRALNTLSPREAQLLRLYYRNREPVAEIAAAMLISRSQLFRIRRSAELRLAPVIADVA